MNSGISFICCILYSYHMVHADIAVNSIARIASAGLGDFDGFGTAIALSNNRFIATQNFRESSNERNVVIVFERRSYDNAWIETTLLKADFRAHNLDGYGSQLSLAGSLALIGAFAGSDKGSQSGYAFIFRAQGSMWTQAAKLVAPDGAPNDRFGDAVCLYNGMAWIGAPGKKTVYIYRPDGDISWFVHDKLTQPRSPNFGNAIAAHGPLVVIGATHDSSASDDAGAAFVYEATSMGTWEQTTKLIASDVEAFDSFGCAVSVYDDSIVVGAPYDDDYGTNSGSVWLFTRQSGLSDAWTQTSRLNPTDASPSDNFGLSVAVNDRWAVVGVEPYWTGGIPPGSVYFFDKHSGEQLLDGLEGIDGSARYVDIVDNTVLVAGPASDDYGHASGAVYVLDMQTNPTATPTAPSPQPTTIPTSPSGQPSCSPSITPSAVPSVVPSGQPSVRPSAPSAPPTGTPSAQPSSIPTQQPSRPTVSPSGTPSAVPTTIPTPEPSCPSCAPSSGPSSRPSTTPTQSPFSDPTAAPAGPTTAPSSHPTVFSTNRISSIASKSRGRLSVGMTVGLFAIAAAVVGALAGYGVYVSRRQHDRQEIASEYERNIAMTVIDSAY